MFTFQLPTASSCAIPVVLYGMMGGFLTVDTCLFITLVSCLAMIDPDTVANATTALSIVSRHYDWDNALKTYNDCLCLCVARC